MKTIHESIDIIYNELGVFPTINDKSGIWSVNYKQLKLMFRSDNRYSYKPQHPIKIVVQSENSFEPFDTISSAIDRMKNDSQKKDLSNNSVNEQIGVFKW